MKGQLRTSDQATKCNKQHTTACIDCPFARNSIKGWLGGSSIAWWLQVAHSDGLVDCHTKIGLQGEAYQCAGIAIYRSNVVKRVYPPNLELPGNKTLVFGSPLEFAEHHSNGKIHTQRQLQRKMIDGLNQILRERRV